MGARLDLKGDVFVSLSQAVAAQDVGEKLQPIAQREAEIPVTAVLDDVGQFMGNEFQPGWRAGGIPPWNDPDKEAKGNRHGRHDRQAANPPRKPIHAPENIPAKVQLWKERL
jgi:hypothetical protein